MTIRVLVLETPLISSVGYWRFFLPLQVVKTVYRNGPVEFDIQYKKKNLDYNDAWRADVVIVPRPGTVDKGLEFVEAAKGAGARIIVDLDDDILNLPEDHLLYHTYKRRQKEAKEIMDLADLMWFSTPKFLETYPKRGIVVKNAIPPEWLPDKPAPDRGLWTWRGNHVQWHDVVLEGSATYDKIKLKPKQWLFLGTQPPLNHADNVSSVGYIEDVVQYIQKVRQSGFNGIWKPMIDCPFNDHKSNISWIEATMSGGVCLTNYAGKPGWEYSTKDFPTYKKACELWEKSKAEIEANYNIFTEARKRAESLVALCSHLLPTSNDMVKT